MTILPSAGGVLYCHLDHHLAFSRVLRWLSRCWHEVTFPGRAELRSKYLGNLFEIFL